MGGGGSQVQRMSKSDKENQVRDLWKNYLSWERDIELRRDRDISSEKARMSGMGMERGTPQWNERIEAINAELDKEKEGLREGATMKSLRDYYAGEDARTFNTGAAADAQEKLREEFKERYGVQTRTVDTGKGQKGKGEQYTEQVRPTPVRQKGRLGEVQMTSQPIDNLGGGTRAKGGSTSIDAQMDQYVRENLDKKIEEIAGGDVDSSMMQFYENKFGTDLSADPEKLSEAEKSQKKAEEAAKGGYTSGKSLNAGSMSPKKKGKNPWI